MREQVEFGPTPVDEDCAQLGSDDYEARARKETHAYLQQLWRMLERDMNVTPETCPKSFRLAARSLAHDFGNYFEVAAIFDDEDEAAIDLALHLEGTLPLVWDDEAKRDLGISACP